MRATVLLPFRDAARTLGLALDSLLAEEGDFEVLAIDDGSVDDGACIVQARDDPRLRLVRGRGRGIVDALNLGLERATAPYVVRMDADDEHVPGRIARSIAALEADPSIGLLGTEVALLADAPLGEGLVRYVEWQNALHTPDEHARELLVESPLCHPTFAMRTTDLRALGGYRDGPFAEDYDLVLRVHRSGRALVKLPFVGLRWRHAAGRLTFRDPRYAPDAFRARKVSFILDLLRDETRPILLWGAGRDGRRMLRELMPAGLTPAALLDIDPKKIGRSAHGVRIVSYTDLPPAGEAFVLGCVGSRGARALIRAELLARGHVELRDFRMLA